MILSGLEIVTNVQNVIIFFVIILSNSVNEGLHKIFIDEPEDYKILF